MRFSIFTCRLVDGYEVARMERVQFCCIELDAEQCEVRLYCNYLWMFVIATQSVIFLSSLSCVVCIFFFFL